jgi:hypothetical protein
MSDMTTRCLACALSHIRSCSKGGTPLRPHVLSRLFVPLAQACEDIDARAARPSASSDDEVREEFGWPEGSGGVCNTVSPARKSRILLGTYPATTRRRRAERE